MGCSSGIGVSHFLNLHKKVVMRSPTLNLMLAEVQGFSKVKKGWQCLYHNKKNHRIVVSSLLNSDAEPESGVEVTIVSNETSTGKDVKILGSKHAPSTRTESESDSGSGDSISGNGGNGKFTGGGGGDGDNGEGDEEEEEFGPLLKFEDVVRETEARGANLPADMMEAAKSVGIRKVLLLRYLDLQGSVWPLGFAMKSCSMLRNRMLADPSFLFKVGTEIVIDSCCATFAEIQKRGKDFWAEFELYAADLLVGVVVNVALVGMLAPYARIGQLSASQGVFGRLQRAYGALPSSVFEAERPGCKFTIEQRIATYFYKGILYGLVGFGCGIIGQGIANLIMTAKRSLIHPAAAIYYKLLPVNLDLKNHFLPTLSLYFRSIKKSEDEIPVPPLVKSAALWGVFLGVSSNTRYQIINGLERLVEASALAKQVPPVAMAFTVGVRFANNVYGGMQFVDWARWSGVQ